MSAEIIISYDGTPNDDDALALGRLLARSGARLALAYVRHSREFDARREELAQHDADRRLAQGAEWLGDPAIARHVVISASTGEGLTELAQAEGAALVVFGSDYRTSPGRVEPGTTAQTMLEGGSVPIAVAAAGLRAQADDPIEWIAVFGDGDRDAAAQTAETLAAKLDANVVADGDDVTAELLVVGSQAAAPEGQIALSGAVRTGLSRARSSVLVLPRGKPVSL